MRSRFMDGLAQFVADLQDCVSRAAHFCYAGKLHIQYLLRLKRMHREFVYTLPEPPPAFTHVQRRAAARIGRYAAQAGCRTVF